MKEEHWFKKACMEDPRDCKHMRNDKCENPVSDCLKYEDAEQDYLMDQEAQQDYRMDQEKEREE